MLGLCIIEWGLTRPDHSYTYVQELSWCRLCRHWRLPPMPPVTAKVASRISVIHKIHGDFLASIGLIFMLSLVSGKSAVLLWSIDSHCCLSIANWSIPIYVYRYTACCHYNLGLYSLSGRTSHRMISWSLEDWNSLNPNLAAARLHEILR